MSSPELLVLLAIRPSASSGGILEKAAIAASGAQYEIVEPGSRENKPGHRVNIFAENWEIPEVFDRILEGDLLVVSIDTPDKDTHFAFSSV